MRKLIALYLFCAAAGHAAIALLGHGDGGSTGGGTYTTGAMNLSNSGAATNALVVLTIVGAKSLAAVPTDSSSNSWTALASVDGAATVRQKTYYACNATVTSTQTITVTGAAAASSVYVTSWSGVATSSCLSGSEVTHATAAATTTQPGSITPTTGYLLITGMALASVGTYSINSGFTISDSLQQSGGNYYGGAQAYLVAPNGSAVNPTWTNTISTEWAVEMAMFAPPAAALAAGSISQTGNSGLTTITLSTTAATGGTPAYSYQWQRTTHGGSFPGTNICANSTSCADSGLSTGTTYDYRVVVTDTIPNTANSTTFSAITLFPVDDSHITTTPGSWYTSGSNPASWMATNRGGAEMRFGFTGTSAVLVLDLTNVITLSDITTAWYVDDAPRSAVTNIAATVTLGTGLAGGTHTARFTALGQGSALNTWTVNGVTPDYVVKIIGVQLDAGSVMAAGPSVPTDKMIFFGDSITAGTFAGPAGASDVLYAYPQAVAYGLNSEPAINGFASSGWNVTADGSNVPIFNSAVGFYWNGQARTLTNLFKRATILLGQNDSGAIGSTIATALTTTRTALGAATKLYVIVPFSQNILAAMNTGLTSYCTTLGSAVTVAGTRSYRTCAGDGNTYYINLGADAQTGLTGAGASYESTDGVHPNTYTDSKLAAYLLQVINKIEAPTGSGPGPIVVN